MWTFPELHYSPKDASWNGIGSTASYCSRELEHDPVGTSRLDSRNREISRNQARKQKLSVSFNYYYFDCTLNDTFTAKMVMFRCQILKWDQNPWFVPETTSILSTFACVRVTPPPSQVFSICRLTPFHRRLLLAKLLLFEFWPKYSLSQRNALHWINSCTNVFKNRSSP